MIIVLDNAESILDPQGTSANEIYTIVDELSRFSNICLCITSRISTVPLNCEAVHIPILSMEAARDTSYRGTGNSPIRSTTSRKNSTSILFLSPYSLLLPDTMRGAPADWTGNGNDSELHAQHSRGLATTIELSLASPMFRELGPDAQGLLGVVAFSPQGVNEKDIDRLFPTASDGLGVFDKFCILSLTYRSNGFVTMLAPLRDYLRPKDPTSSPLLGTTRECYIARLSTDIFPSKPGFEESRWITSSTCLMSPHRLMRTMAQTAALRTGIKDRGTSG